MFGARHFINLLSSGLFYTFLVGSKLKRFIRGEFLRFFLSVFLLPLAAFVVADYFVGYKRSVVIPDIEFESSARDFFPIEGYSPISNFETSGNGVQNFGLNAKLIVPYGQNLASMLKSLDISNSQITRLFADKNIRELKLLPSNELTVNYNCDVEYAADRSSGMDSDVKYNFPLRHVFRKNCWLVELSILQKDRVVYCKMDKSGNSTVAVKKIEFKKAYRVVSGKIRSSLYADAVSAGVPPSIIMQAIGQYSFLLDLQRDIRANDSFVFIFQEILGLNNAIVGSGNLVFANLVLGTKSNEIHLFQGKYYNKKGESVKKALLKTPIDGARITSGFGTRKHPILGYTKKHQGIDFGAPTGTPIYAAGDGVVVFMGPRGGYGNFISIRHNKDLHTNYAHMSRFSSSVSKGSRVFQKQIIGYVGATGRVTGPHLHFEVEVNGRKVNPSSTYLNPGKKLTKAEFEEFRQQQNRVQRMISGNA